MSSSLPFLPFLVLLGALIGGVDGAVSAAYAVVIVLANLALSAALLASAGFAVDSVHGVRVFADLVPGSLLDLEPGATSALLELERAVSGRSEYLPLAAQLHVLAR